jgi:hypothetical protein
MTSKNQIDLLLERILLLILSLIDLIFSDLMYLISNANALCTILMVM